MTRYLFRLTVGGTSRTWQGVAPSDGLKIKSMRLLMAVLDHIPGVRVERQ